MEMRQCFMRTSADATSKCGLNGQIACQLLPGEDYEHVKGRERRPALLDLLIKVNTTYINIMLRNYI